MNTVKTILPLAAMAFLAQPALAQTAVTVDVDAASSLGAYKPIWTYFGYDEPNYTNTPNGKKLLAELAALSRSPVYIRTHNLLTSGDGEGSLKWGSTNAYTEDAQGKPIYSWTILDGIFDAYRDAGVRPLVEIGFMPEALSIHPQPYRHDFPKTSITTGWAYPPKDYDKWAGLVSAWAQHAKERYGAAAVATWKWEVWNEPDGKYWVAKPEEYDRFYDVTAAALKRVLPDAMVGGPHTTGPVVDTAAAYLQQFLEHCAHASGQSAQDPACALDYVGFHAKGGPKFVDGHIEMGISRQLQSIQKGLEIAKSFAEFRSKPVILGESDPEGCAACTPATTPEDGYRNGALYGAYVVETTALTEALAQQEGMDIEGAVTWAFQFENLPYFSGMRDLATHGIDKPVLNAFRLMGMLNGNRLAVHSSGALAVADVVQHGIHGRADINATATRRGREIDVLVWNYGDDDVPASAAPVDLVVHGLPEDALRVLSTHFRLDDTHSNAYTAWLAMNSPQSPTPEQQASLEAAGQLQTLGSPEWATPADGAVQLHFALSHSGVSLVRLSW
jgi:xylan 1,4-beta-xylosidase